MADPEKRTIKPLTRVSISLRASSAGVSPKSSMCQYSTSVQPTSFANGRYQVKEFLGEGGKKRVYQAHDSVLDRDVAFVLINTEGPDDAPRSRILREAQAMGRPGAHRAYWDRRAPSHPGGRVYSPESYTV